MSTLNSLLRQVEQSNAQLAADLAKEFKALSDRRAFGLNFERHIPETVDLPGRAVRKGDKVRFCPAPGETSAPSDKRVWRVVGFGSQGGARVAHLALPDSDGVETATREIASLVVVAEFRDPIYPGLSSTDRVERGGDKPFHTVINSENYHALQALLYTHEGRVDVIYIDPPYNTGAKDWKYNNDYVDGEDIYRHSKWLSFMERRLKIAKRLLNPAESVLIVTIDEKEYLRLGLLLKQIFPEARQQMISSVIKPSGSRRAAEFSRVEEYVYFVMLGTAAPAPWRSDMLRNVSGEDAEQSEASVTWHGLRRRGSTDWKRSHRPNGFYPIYVNRETGAIHSVGEPLEANASRAEVVPPAGTFAAWPLAPDGGEGRWQISPDRFRAQLEAGTLLLNSADPETGQCSVLYLKSGDLKKIADGDLTVTGREADGRLSLKAAVGDARRPKTMWVMDSHDASTHGTVLVKSLIGDRGFPFPKSLYAVEDCLRFFVANKPEAVILDFFSGSGTTAHAVMRLNRQLGGSRRSISVTNNEVSAEEQVALRARGLRAGDSDWEAHGICDYITKPRIRAAVTGETPDGAAIRGEYKFVDEFPMSEGFEENVEFFTLTYEAPRAVAHNRSFPAVAPLLWLKAGAQGGRIEQVSDGFATADKYAILFDLDGSSGFLHAIASTPSIGMAFIVTDDDRAFQMICTDLPEHVEPVRLYESYLTNFTINTGRE